MKANPRAGTPNKRPLKIVVDARWTRTQLHDGVSRYAANLIQELRHLHSVTILIHDERQLSLLPDNVSVVRVPSPLSPRELLLSRTLHKLDADVVFTPLQVIGGFRRRYALIVTLHDLIYYRNPRPPDSLPWPVRLAWRLYHRMYWPQRWMLNRADAVVTVSETTKRLMLDRKLTRRPIRVIPNAPSHQHPETVAKHPPANAPSEHVSRSGAQSLSQQQRDHSWVRRSLLGCRSGDLVYIGSFMPYKNVETLIAGMASLPHHRLHLVSPIGPARERELRKWISRGGDVVLWRGLSDPDYWDLLEKATALVTASRDEGFGLPVVEAMNIGTPVVCSDIAIFREVTGGHARFFSPDSPESFAASVLALGNAETRAAMVQAARAQAARYSWATSAKCLLKLMYEVSRPKSTMDQNEERFLEGQ